MSAPLRPLAYGDYKFDAPLLLLGDQPNLLDDPASWQTAAGWTQTIDDLAGDLKAVVLPLEIQAAGANYQDLLGYELLSALRWSAADSVRGRPVLLVAWQPLQNILRRKPDLLILRPGTIFMRLPEAAEFVEQFFRNVAAGSIAAASVGEIEASAGAVDQAARIVSYHDLANDYYAAYRMWKGYQSLVRQAAGRGIPEAQEEVGAAATTRFPWESYVEEKLRSPLIRRFQASRAALSLPRYPTIDNDLDILGYHLRHGLPDGARLLLVDDEFQKGSAEILLRILFRQPVFTKQLQDEWVYAESNNQESNERWARFVCVRTAALARHWLAYWDHIEIDDVSRTSGWQQWLARWDTELNPLSKRAGAVVLEPEDVFAQNREFVLDRHSAGPRAKSSIVLLDLRLEPVQRALYSVKDFPSYQLRRTIKAENPDMPVIMFTASRQILNFAELLDSSRDIDGWFIKEGPDVPVDATDSNSANSIAYLLERVHLYSTLTGWYRETYGWDTERKLAYARVFHSKKAATVFNEVSRVAAELFGQIQSDKMDWKPGDTQTFLAFLQERVAATPFPVVQTLVARRVAIACLLWTAKVGLRGLEWDADAFDRLLPGRPSKKLVKAVYDKLNFNQVLWMRSSGVLSQLLREEFDWLESLAWPEEKRQAILLALRSERQLLGL